MFAEDPGAANFVAELPRALSRSGIETILLAAGSAAPYIERRGAGRAVAEAGGDARSVLTRHRPQLVLVGTSGNPESLGLRLVGECAKRGIPTVGAVDSPEGSEHRFRGRSDDPLAWAPDCLLVPDGFIAERYLELGYPAKQIVICGDPHFDYVRGAAARLLPRREDLRRSLYPDSPAGSRIVLFAGEATAGLDPCAYQRSEGYTLAGRGPSVGRSEIVIEEFLDAASLQDPPPYRVLRIHPKNDRTQFAPYLAEFQQVNQAGDALEAIAGADAVVGMTTMLIVEAVLMGKPTLSIVPRPVEREWLATTRLGLTPCASNRRDVRAYLTRLVRDLPVPPDAEVDELLPPGALNRAARAIMQLLAKASAPAVN
jgi:hypothetical protein